MTEPKWLSYNLVLFIHKQQILEHGGVSGIRDKGLLMSALDKPRNLYNYSTPGYADLAASYAYGISRNHPFMDGNKRVSAVVCEVFLELNNRRMDVSDEEFYSWMITLAAGELSEQGLADCIRRRLIGWGDPAMLWTRLRESESSVNKIVLANDVNNQS